MLSRVNPFTNNGLPEYQLYHTQNYKVIENYTDVWSMYGLEMDLHIGC